MDQVLIFTPKFNLESKSVHFGCGFHIDKFMKKYDIPSELWYYETYGIDSLKDPELKPTKYESYVFMDLGDDVEKWDFIYTVLGFKNRPGRFRLESFKFGKIDINVSMVTNEVGESFLKLQGNTTRKVLNMVIEALSNVMDWRLHVHQMVSHGNDTKYEDVDYTIDTLEQIFFDNYLGR